MDSQESTKDNRIFQEDKFYRGEVRLVDGINEADIISGKGTMFTVKEDENFSEPLPEKVWQSNEYNSIGIDPDIHEGGAFKSIEKDFVNVTEDGLVLKKITQPGMGKIIPPRAWVKAHYCYYSEARDEPIDSTWLRGRPQCFTLGEGEVIAVLDLAVGTMKKGEKAQFLADHKYGFGKMGVPPRIPPKARLFFDVEIVHYLDENMITEYDQLSNDDKKDIPLDKMLTIASVLREKGNEHYKKNTRTAFNSYLKAVRILESHGASDSHEEALVQREQIKSLINLSTTCLEMGRTADARMHADEAIKFLLSDMNKDPFKLGKLHYIKHKTYIKEQKLRDARRSLQEAVKHVPDDKTIREAFTKLEKAQEREDFLEKDTMQKMGEKLGWISVDDPSTSGPKS